MIPLPLSHYETDAAHKLGKEGRPDHLDRHDHLYLGRDAVRALSYLPTEQ